MSAEAPIVSDRLQADFVARYGNPKDGEVRLVPEALFSATRRQHHNARVYHTEGMGFGTGAIYGEEFSGLPKQVIRVLGHNEHLNISIDLKPHGGGFGFNGRHGDYSFYAQYFPHEGEGQSRLFLMGIDDERISRYESGHKRTWMPYWTEIQDRADADEILAKGSTSYDREAGVFEARLDDLVLRVRDAAPINGILDRYFPPELRDYPLEAGIEHDIWARADWMQDFGITWSRVVSTEVSVFTSSS